MECLYFAMCMQCASASAAETATGMPCCLSLLCTNPYFVRNLVRYQYRIEGNDFIDEFCRITMLVMLSYLPICGPLCVCACAANDIAQFSLEAKQNDNYYGRYLTQEFVTDEAAEQAPPPRRGSHFEKSSREHGLGDGAEPVATVSVVGLAATAKTKSVEVTPVKSSVGARSGDGGDIEITPTQYVQVRSAEATPVLK